MKLRRILLAVMVATGVAVAPAAAAPRCPLMTDPVGDAAFGAPPAGDDPSLDFTSADIVSDATRLTVVMRVAQLSLPAAGSPAGVLYEYGFTVSGRAYVLAASYSVASGSKFVLRTQQKTSASPIDLYVNGDTGAKVDGVFDEDRSEVRMTVLLKDVPPGLRSGQPVGAFRLISWILVEEWVMSSDFIYNTGKRYVLGARGCIKVGS